MVKLTVKIDPKGKVVTEVVEGVVGESCQRLTASLLSALGTKVAEDLKPEYYAAVTTEQELIQVQQ